MRNNSLTERSRRLEICDRVIGALAVASSSSTSRPFSRAGARYFAPPWAPLASSSAVWSLGFNILIQSIESPRIVRQNRVAQVRTSVVEPAQCPVKP